MRIAIVETAPQGGLLHYSVQLADALAERGHEVDMIATRGHELERHSGAATMRDVLARQPRFATLPRPGIGYVVRRGRIALRLVRAWARVAWEARTRHYDVVIVDSDLGLSLVAAACAALAAAPGGPAIANVCHNVRPYNRGAGDDLHSSSPLLMRLLRAFYARVDLVFVHGERSRREFEATWPPARLAEIPHGDERMFGDEPPPPADEERVLFFGDWRKVKGLPLLMEAFDELASRRPSARLTIAGTAAPADFDPDVVRGWARGHDGRVLLVDEYVPVEDVAAVFGSARVVATPYLVAYQSGVVHLAMTMARAVVATDVGDLPSAVADGETGIVVPPEDAPALAAALERLLADRELAERYGAAGRRRAVEGSGWEAVAERAEAALQAALARG
jgi:glycosyltransferase involved in cell wall biosynthesis